MIPPLLPSLKQRVTFDSLREHLLDRLLLASTVAYLLILLIVFLRAAEIGWIANNGWQITFYSLLLLLVWRRKRLPYRWRVGFLLGLWWLGATTTLLLNGPLSDAKSMLMLVAMMSIFLLPVRAGIAMVGVVALTIGTVGVMVVTTDWQFSVDYDSFIHHPLTWGKSVLQLSLISGIASYTIWLMVHALRSALEQSQEHSRQLQQALSRQEALFASSNVAIAILKDRVFVEANDYLAQLLGYGREELIGRSTQGLHVDDAHDQVFARTVYTQLAQQRHTSIEYPFRHRAGHWVWIYLSISALEDGDVALVGIDVTELRQAREAANTANRTKSAFLANMSHELRTPLNAVLGFAQILAAAPNLEARQQDYVRAIHHSGDHLLELLNDVLDLAKIEEGQVEPVATDWSPGALFPEMIRLFSARAEEKGITLHFRASEPLPEWLRCDARLLRQVLMNLLGNAVKFTDHGGVTLRAAFAEGQLRVAVEDSGIGIPPEEIDGIFERYRQSGAEHHRRQGTGLGLTISRSLVEAMGGTLGVTSAPGSGSLFRVEIPALMVTGAPRSSPPAQGDSSRRWAAWPRPDGAPARVLVVDDVLPNRLLLQALLELMGFVVETAEGGEEALARVAQRPPEGVMMDLRMPEMDGLVATRRLRQQGFAGPVIIVSASAFEANRRAALAAGGSAFMVKPIALNDLGEALEQVGMVLRVDGAGQPPPTSGATGSSAPGGDDRLLDLDILEEHRHAIAADTFNQILDEYEQRANGYLQVLLDAVRTRQLPEAERAAHRLGGVAAVLGLTGLQHGCEAIEADLHAMSEAQTATAADHLARVFQATTAALTAYRQRLVGEAQP